MCGDCVKLVEDCQEEKTPFPARYGKGILSLIFKVGLPQVAETYRVDYLPEMDTRRPYFLTQVNTRGKSSSEDHYDTLENALCEMAYKVAYED